MTHLICVIFLTAVHVPMSSDISLNRWVSPAPSSFSALCSSWPSWSKV